MSLILFGCGKKSTNTIPVEPLLPPSFSSSLIMLNGKQETSLDYSINTTPVIKFSSSSSVDAASVNSSFSFTEANGTSVSFNTSYSSSDSVVIIQPSALKFLTKHAVTVSATLKSKVGGDLKASATLNFITQIDSSDKFTRISDAALLDLIQQQTFKYLWDFGHPVSGMARERNTSDDVVITSGCGIYLFMSSPEIKRGMKQLGFQSQNL